MEMICGNLIFPRENDRFSARSGTSVPFYPDREHMMINKREMRMAPICLIARDPVSILDGERKREREKKREDMISRAVRQVDRNNHNGTTRPRCGRCLILLSAIPAR